MTTRNNCIVIIIYFTITRFSPNFTFYFTSYTDNIIYINIIDFYDFFIRNKNISILIKANKAFLVEPEVLQPLAA